MVDMREKWSYLLKESDRMSEEEARSLLKSGGGEMSEAVNHFLELSRDEKLQLIEENRQKHIMDQKAREAYVLEKGIEKGRKEGIKETVSMMLREKSEISFISRVTGLSEEEIRKIELENSR